ncbi:hypothetical protein WR25_12189 [Diploscapter pachys]|uniref:Pseudouridine synthase I TruA alpha/beta domain-containing protein n=1 Tax=Diploscapter pachys TaxID=2018661 RepID=A0A2A2LX93_9BILA|nr:hypothetical protein WR25_12189 [Diploscapter pachys]
MSEGGSQGARKRTAMDSANGDLEVKKAKKEFDFDAHPKRKIALQFLYFGWLYDGLVQQENTTNTVEAYLEAALLKTRLISSFAACDISRCGLTDKGVSAHKQVAALIVRSNDKDGEGVFWSDSTPQAVRDAYPRKDELNFVRMLNGVLPREIRITAWAPVPVDFSARHSCSGRAYKYAFPRTIRTLDVEAMQKACDLLVGTHDFRNFAMIDDDKVSLNKSYIRDFYEAKVVVKPESFRTSEDEDSEGLTSIQNQYDLIELNVSASGFAYHQIRYIVAILYQIGLGNEGPELVSQLLNIEKMPGRPQYKMATDTPLCLFETKFDSSNLDWRYDEVSTKGTLESMQKSWSDFVTRAHVLKSMIEEMKGKANEEVSNGFYEFVMSHPKPRKHNPIASLPKCYSLEERRDKYNTKMAKKLALVGYDRDYLDLDDDTDLARLICTLDEMHLKKKSEDWAAELLDEKNDERRKEIINEYLTNLGIDPQLGVRIVVDKLLNLAIDRLYETSEVARNLTAASYEEEFERRKRTLKSFNPLENVDLNSAEFSEHVKRLCDAIGICEHTDNLVRLRAALVFIKKHLSEEAILEHNKRAEAAKTKAPKQLALNSFPLGIPDQKHASVNVAAKILRLLNIEELRRLQTHINETLAAIQAKTIDMSKAPNYDQVQYGY